MSLADEIRQLKELMDSGALTADEFERAKQGLLSKISAPSIPASTLVKAAIVGKWKERSDKPGVSGVYQFKEDGKCVLFIESTEFSLSQKLLTGTQLNGTWWLEGNVIGVSLISSGHAFGRALNAFVGQPLGAALEFRYTVESLTAQEMSGILDDGDGSPGRFYLDRLGL